MPSNLLDKITWNFIHEIQAPDGKSYIQTALEKLEKLRPNGSDVARVATAKEDLKKVRSHVIRLEHRIIELESELKNTNEKLEDTNKKLERLKAKSRTPKEE